MVRLNQDIVYAMNRFRPPIRDIRKRVERYGVVGASPDNYSRRTLWSNLIREYEIESKASLLCGLYWIRCQDVATPGKC